MWFFFLLGAILFLIMEHAVVFWILFVPLILLFVVSLLKFFGESGSSVKDLVVAMCILAVMVVALMIVCIP